MGSLPGAGPVVDVHARGPLQPGHRAHPPGPARRGGGGAAAFRERRARRLPRRRGARVAARAGGEGTMTTNREHGVARAAGALATLVLAGGLAGGCYMVVDGDANAGGDPRVQGGTA